MFLPESPLRRREFVQRQLCESCILGGICLQKNLDGILMALRFTGLVSLEVAAQLRFVTLAYNLTKLWGHQPFVAALAEKNQIAAAVGLGLFPDQATVDGV